MKLRLLIIFFVFLYNFYSIYGQGKKIYVKKQVVDLKTILSDIDRSSDINIFYNPDSIPDATIKVEQDRIQLFNFLESIFKNYGFNISKDDEGNYFIFKNFVLQTNVEKFFKNRYVKQNESLKKHENKNIKNYLDANKSFISENIVIGEKDFLNKKEKFHLSGIVTDNAGNSPVNQAKITIVELNKSILTNKLGYYEFYLPSGEYTLVVRSMIMYEKLYKIAIYDNGELNIPLRIKSYEIDEITISANQNDNVKSINMGFEKITAKSIKELPSILGEKDIVKVALLLPGVQTIGELSSGFNVRGSPADQNIFYINNLPIYNSSHVFGLFTAFNGEAISEFKFYKSNLPIEYGGSLSSIFDIVAKKGDLHHFSARGGIGLTSGRVMFEGPLWKEKISYLISLRSSYSDWLLSLIKNTNINNSSISFYDALVNVSGSINSNNNIDLFFYKSNDLSDLAFGIKNKYSNTGSSLKWKHNFSENFKNEFSYVKSIYSFNEENIEIKYLGYKHSFTLNHDELKLKFKYYSNNNYLQFGLNSKYYKLKIGDFLPINKKSLVKSINFEGEQAINNSIFVGDKWNVNNKLTFEAGLRYTYYSYLGKKTIYSYEENSPRVFDNIIDSVKYGKNELINNNSSFDYRFSGRYKFNRVSSIKASYNILHQYIFMLSNTVSISPTNRWKLSDPNIKPMAGEQYSLGFYKNLLNNFFNLSIELYYKRVKNLVEYKDGAIFLQNKLPETNIIQGTLSSYGLEFMLKKKIGKLNGWVNYTYSNATVNAFDVLTGEMNNMGLPYSADYDRPNAVNLTLNYKFSKRINVSTNVIYSTGRPVTYPNSIYYLNGIEITSFSGRNEYRIPDYFRTDISINIEGNLKKYKFAHSSWSLSFYNITARKNPYSVLFQNKNGKIKGYKISILGTIIPSLTYNLKFGNYED